MELRGLCKSYRGKIVLDIEELDISEGRITAFVGENGAGKTTLFRILSGLSFPTKGSVSFANPSGIPGVMIELPAIDMKMSAWENLSWVSRVYGRDGCMDIQELLALVGLEKNNTKVKKYSLGMKQRLGIAMCLAHNPNLLILDEPMNGLDPVGMMDLRNILHKINEKGTTILISSHILSELYKIASEYVFMKEGKVIQVKSSRDFEELEANYYELLTSDNDKATRLLKDTLHCKVKEDGGRMLFNKGSNTIMDISKLLCENKIYILMLKEKGFDIESYYMEVLDKNA